MVEKRKIPEFIKQIEFSQVKLAFQVFANDYKIVKHPNTPVRTPFERPNQSDEKGERQYNLSIIPKNMTESQFLKKLKGTLVISCMDRDVTLPLYNRVKKEDSKTPIIFLSMAGGIVQERDERKKALAIILTYISQHQENIAHVIATDHDHTCGYVKYELEGTPLAEKVGVQPAIKGDHSDQKEQQAMKSLIIQNARYFKLKKLFRRKLNLALAVIDRQGNIDLDMDFQRIKSKKLTDF